MIKQKKTKKKKKYHKSKNTKKGKSGAKINLENKTLETQLVANARMGKKKDGKKINEN